MKPNKHGPAAGQWYLANPAIRTRVRMGWIYVLGALQVLDHQGRHVQRVRQERPEVAHRGERQREAQGMWSPRRFATSLRSIGRVPTPPASKSRQTRGSSTQG